MEIPLFKNSNMMVIHYSCKSSRAISKRNHFHITHFCLLTSEPCLGQEWLGCLLKTLKTHNTSFRQKRMAWSGWKMIMFCISNFYWQIAQNNTATTSWKWAILTSQWQCYTALKRGWTYLVEKLEDISSIWQNRTAKWWWVEILEDISTLAFDRTGQQSDFGYRD